MTHGHKLLLPQHQHIGRSSRGRAVGALGPARVPPDMADTVGMAGMAVCESVSVRLTPEGTSATATRVVTPRHRSIAITGKGTCAVIARQQAKQAKLLLAATPKQHRAGHNEGTITTSKRWKRRWRVLGP